MTNTTSFANLKPAPEIRDHYDVVVVGARAAGAATAMLLARDGFEVLVVDKAAYGSDTLSSHALMRGAVSSLSRWGLLDQVYDAGTPVVTKTKFTYGSEELILDIPSTPEIPGLVAPRRTVLDPILVDAAVLAGATVVHETRLTGITTDGLGRVCGINIDHPHGVRSVTTDLLIGADGLRSTVARQLQIPITRKGSSASAYVMQYFTDLDRADDTFEWLYRPGIGAGVIPTNGGVFCVFAAMTTEQFRNGARQNTKAAMVEVLSKLDPGLGNSILAATPLGPIRSWPGVPGQFRKAFGPGWALVGDAGYFKDPYAAHGISDAFRDAELLAKAVKSGDFEHYETHRDQLSAPLFDVLEKIASYEWDLSTLPGLHHQLSKAMREEGKALSADIEPMKLASA